MKKTAFLIFIFSVGAGTILHAEVRGGKLRSSSDRDMELAVVDRVGDHADLDIKPAAKVDVNAGLQSRVDEIFDSLPPIEKHAVVGKKEVEKSVSTHKIFEVTEPHLARKLQLTNEELVESAFNNLEP